MAPGPCHTLKAMNQMRPQRGGLHSTLAVGLAGLFAGHVLAYRLAAPTPTQAALMRSASTHSYLGLALTIALGLAGVAAVAALRWGFRASRAGRRPLAHPPGPTAALSALGQALAFVVLEIVERLASGAGLNTLSGRLLVVGIAIQLLTGALGGLVLMALHQAGARAGRWRWAGRRPRHRTPVVPVPASQCLWPARLVAVQPFGSRGPPLTR